jgi:hypothetical protein
VSAPGEASDRAAGPVFVVGAARSGTTLLSAMLAAHSRLTICPETHFLDEWWDGRSLTFRSVHEFEDFWERYSCSPRFAALGLNPQSVMRSSAGSPPSYPELFLRLLQAYAAQHAKEIPGEKTPQHERFLSTLLGWFPGGRVLFLLRDPRAVVASQRRMPWSRDSLAELAWRWRASARRLRRITGHPRVHLVQYEQLVVNPAATLQAVCDFLDLRMEPSMFQDYPEAARPLTAGQPWKKRALEPLDPSPITQWRQELAPAEMALVDRLCRSGMQWAGYVPSGEGRIRPRHRSFSGCQPDCCPRQNPWVSTRDFSRS